MRRFVVKDLNKVMGCWSSPSIDRAKPAFFNLGNVVIEHIESVDYPSTWRVSGENIEMDYIAYSC